MLYPRLTSTLISGVFLLATAARMPAQEFTSSDYTRTMRQAINLVDHRQFADAGTLLEKSLEHLQEPGHSEWRVLVLSFLGSIYQSAGRYADAEQSLNTSIRELTELKGPNTLELVGPLANLGALFYEAGQYTKAERLLSRALELQQSNKNDPSLTAMLLTNLGSVYFTQHKDDLAQQRAEEAMKRFDLAPDTGIEFRQGEARNYALLGALSIESHNEQQAESYLQKALDIWTAVAAPDDPRRAEAIANLAILYSINGDLERSEGMFKQAQSIFDVRGGDNAFMQHYLTEYSGLEQKLGHKKEAKQLTKQLQRLTNISAQNTLSRDIVDVSAFR